MEPLIPGMTGHDELRASNAVLKLKLETEHGMTAPNASGLGPALENIFLKFIYDHAQARRTCGVVKLYDFVGRPAYTPLAELDPTATASELVRLCRVLAASGVVFDWACQYDDAELYEFVTTELFELEVDDLKLPGLLMHFTYEEFHMNNRYEVERIGMSLLRSIYHHEWRPEYDSIWIGADVKCNGVDYDFQRFSALILDFQQRHESLEIEKLLVDRLELNAAETEGYIKISIHYQAQLRGERHPSIRLGSCLLHFAKEAESGQWSVTATELPGIMASL